MNEVVASFNSLLWAVAKYRYLKHDFWLKCAAHRVGPEELAAATGKPRRVARAFELPGWRRPDCGIPE